MTGRADALALVHDVALVALGAGMALVVLGVAVIHEQRAKARRLRASVQRVRRESDRIIPPRTLATPSVPHVKVPPVPHLDDQRMAHKHGAAAQRRANH